MPSSPSTQHTTSEYAKRPSSATPMRSKEDMFASSASVSRSAHNSSPINDSKANSLPHQRVISAANTASRIGTVIDASYGGGVASYTGSGGIVALTSTFDQSAGSQEVKAPKLWRNDGAHLCTII